MKNLTKKLISFSIAIVSLLFFCIISTFSLLTVKADELVVKSFDNTDVLEDLQTSSDVNGNAFDISNYGFDSSRALSIQTVVEYGYTYDSAKNSSYGIYIYIYNPDNLTIQPTSSGNQVTMAISFYENGNGKTYEKFNLSYCGQTQGKYANLFYKYKLVDHVGADGKTLYERVNPDCRRYVFGALYLELGNVVQSYEFGRDCTFTGYAKGCGPDESAENTLTGTVKSTTTVHLNVKDTYYRPGVEYKNDTQMQLNSVYFAVPNDILNEYPALDNVLVSWNEQKTKPILVTDNSTIKSVVQTNRNSGSKTFSGYSIYGNPKITSSTNVVNHYSYDWAYNPTSGFCHATENAVIYDKFQYLFYTEDLNTPLSGDELLSYIDIFKDNGVYDLKNIDRVTIGHRSLPVHLFDNVDEGRKQGFNSFNINRNTDYTLEILKDQRPRFWSAIFGPKEELTQPDEYKNINAIQRVSLSDFLQPGNKDFSKDFLIAKDNVSAFVDYVTQESLDGKTTFLCRFAVTDYYSSPFSFVAEGSGSTPMGTDGYLCQETIFFDFNVITLTFADDNNRYLTVPAVANPIDIVSDLTPPADDYEKSDDLFFPGDNFFSDDNESWWDKLLTTLKWIGIILLAIGLLIVLSIFFPVLKPIFKVIGKVLWFIVTLPYQCAKWLIKVIKRE